MLHFLIPAHPLEPHEPDAPFAAQFEALRGAGFSASLLPDSALRDGRPLRRIPPSAAVVYRGWMLKPREYETLAAAVVAAAAAPLTSADQYVAAHYLPNWYPKIAEFTPETRVYPAHADLEPELRALGWGEFFLKDYVKSLKTAPGAIVRDPASAGAVLSAMEQYRGEIEGGLCVRRVEPFLPETERRYFAIAGRPFAPDDGEVPEIVSACASRIDSPFFSIDVVQRADGALRVVEVGDGQVSDLVGWSAEAFANAWAATRERPAPAS